MFALALQQILCEQEKKSEIYSKSLETSHIIFIKNSTLIVYLFCVEYNIPNGERKRVKGL